MAEAKTDKCDAGELDSMESSDEEGKMKFHKK